MQSIEKRVSKLEGECRAREGAYDLSALSPDELREILAEIERLTEVENAKP